SSLTCRQVVFEDFFQPSQPLALPTEVNPSSVAGGEFYSNLSRCQLQPRTAFASKSEPSDTLQTT
ncbi:hypothetical protein, partial [Serpens gallinarum]|uniref:hypothetical protein n=1 Tax=Serpens gallinarum TaxID=2763075 RepID=UPI002044D4AF